jgi:hypothetical protein
MRAVMLTLVVLIFLSSGLYFSGYGIRVDERFDAMTTRCTYFDGIEAKFSYSLIPTHCALLGKAQFHY